MHDQLSWSFKVFPFISSSHFFCFLFCNVFSLNSNNYIIYYLGQPMLQINHQLLLLWIWMSITQNFNKSNKFHSVFDLSQYTCFERSHKHTGSRKNFMAAINAASAHQNTALQLFSNIVSVPWASQLPATSTSSPQDQDINSSLHFHPAAETGQGYCPGACRLLTYGGASHGQ